VLLDDVADFPVVDRDVEVEPLARDEDDLDADPLLVDADLALDPLDPDLELPVDLVAVLFFAGEPVDDDTLLREREEADFDIDFEAGDFEPPDLDVYDFEGLDFELADFLVVGMIFLRVIELV
jgi:hypothetical protein